VKKLAAAALCALTIPLFAQPSVVTVVRAMIAQNDLAGAQRLVRSMQAQTPPRPELAAAISWIARAQLSAGNLDQADTFATETEKMAAPFTRAQTVDKDPWLPTAVGASIEVHALVRVARGERSEALAYLNDRLKEFGSTSMAERIRKNINLLNLEGKPAPPLEMAQWLGSKPGALAALHGRPVLLFFWAHWCSDCKAEVAILANLRKRFAPQGLAVIGPTRLYGYVAGGEDAPPEKERRYIEQIRNRFYAALSGMPVPLSAANFVTYGASSTPTLVLIDRAGIVRYYHPGAAPEAELVTRVQGVLR
jgi:thiol-disulfide isomerase/thioredoxin